MGYSMHDLMAQVRHGKAVQVCFLSAPAAKNSTWFNCVTTVLAGSALHKTCFLKLWIYIKCPAVFDGGASPLPVCNLSIWLVPEPGLNTSWLFVTDILPVPVSFPWWVWRCTLQATQIISTKRHHSQTYSGFRKYSFCVHHLVATETALKM